MMRTVITRCPLRVSFFGGGSDVPSHYEEHGGIVVGTTIDHYIYITATRKLIEKDVRLVYSQTERVDNAHELRHDLARACLRYAGITHDIEIASTGTLPDTGTGLATSSAYTNALLLALHHMNSDAKLPAEHLAERACTVELEILGRPIGKQDQYLTALGGSQCLTFTSLGVWHREIALSEQKRSLLQRHGMLVYLGGRNAHDIYSKLRVESASVKKLADFANTACDQLDNDYRDPQWLGEALDEYWHLKKQVSGVSNHFVDMIYSTCKSAGAWGGKLLGAGGSGFMLIIAPENRQSEIKARVGLPVIEFRPGRTGAQVILVQDL